MATTLSAPSSQTFAYSGYLPVVTALFFVTRALDFTTSAASTLQPVAMGLKSCQKTSRPYSFVPHLPSYLSLNAASFVVSFGRTTAYVFGTLLPLGHATGRRAVYLIRLLSPCAVSVIADVCTRPI